MARQATLAMRTATAVPPHLSLSHILQHAAQQTATERARTSGRSETPGRDLRLPARLAAVFFAGSGFLVLVTLPVPVPGLDVAVMAAVGAVALAIGIAVWALPWERWPQSVTLVLMAPAFSLIALANTFGVDTGGANAAGPQMAGAGGPQPYGVFFLVAFVWLGMAHPPFTSVTLAPFAALACVLPWFPIHGHAGGRLYSTLLIIPLCVLIGEGTAWASARLDRAELALRREKDQTERLRELDERKDRFLLSVSHELRNPITVCRGHLDVLDDRAGERDVRAAKGTVIGQLDLMTRLVEDLTTLAMVDDTARLRLETLCARSFADSVAEQAKSLLGDRFRADSSVPDGMLLVDPQRLNQALLNLVRNAAEHAGTGLVRFRVRTDAAGCRFEIADEGGGLPLGTEEAVFEPFQTASSATGGTGLGLSIVRGIARAHGGEAGVDNRPGRGATFWIRVPR